MDFKNVREYIINIGDVPSPLMKTRNILVIGALAGSVQGLRTFFDNVPANPLFSLCGDPASFT
jgi:hypothetical protein